MARKENQNLLLHRTGLSGEVVETSIIIVI